MAGLEPLLLTQTELLGLTGPIAILPLKECSLSLTADKGVVRVRQHYLPVGTALVGQMLP